MDLELVKALMVLVRHCTACGNCEDCKLKEFCGKTFQSF